MRTLASLGLLLSLAVPTTGCIVVPGRAYYAPHHRASHRAVCPPSHYWDGYACRHKGNGRGARKHDYHGAVPVR